MLGVVAGFDIGGTKISLVLVDRGGELVHRAVEPTDSTTGTLEYTPEYTVYHGLSAQLTRMLREALREVQTSQLEAIGTVSAGPIRDGALWSPANIVPASIRPSHRDLPRLIPLVGPLRQAFSCPVGLLNDCSGAVLGEVHFGLGRETVDKSTLHLAYATISTGFGVGAWDGGHLVLGKEGNAGELGHLVARVDGLPCGCGNRGCVEAYASGSGIVKNAGTRLRKLGEADRDASPLIGLLRGAEAPATGPREIEPLLDALSPALVFDAAATGDPIATAVIDDAVFAAGVGLSAIANAYDPAIISVGGAIALAHPDLLDPMRDEMLRHINVTPPDVALTSLGAQVTERGAVALARRLRDRGSG